MNETEILISVLQIEDAAERDKYLEQVYQGDAAKIAAIRRILSLEKILAQPELTSESKPLVGEQTVTQKFSAHEKYETTSSSGIQQTYGPYRLIEEIGAGGMGSVWRAEQSEPIRREVALKIIKAGMDTKAVISRFENERQALAMMDHPNIAKVLDAGVSPTGQPFFVMELVKGLPLTKFADEAKLTTNERLELFVLICNAIQHAHQKGIVHRDLKPANILVTSIDGRPVPKVIDFGVAKAIGGNLLDESIETQLGAVIGTLEYMSPEQAGYSGVDIDTRADIYSLGVVLYELLTGLRPIDRNRLKAAGIGEMIRVIKEDEPSKPSTRLSTNDALPSLAATRKIDPRKLTALLKGELDWVIMKCLEKSRDRRYETANGLGRDLQRFLAGETVEARPASTSYRLSKFVRRNKGLVVTTSLVTLTLLAGILGTSLGMLEANRQRNRAEEKAEEADKARIEETQQRMLAQTANQQALDALQSFTSDLMEDLLGSRTEINAVERKVLIDALKQWEMFANSKGDSIEAQKMRAQGANNLAIIQFRLGMIPEAVESDQKAVDIWKNLFDRHPNDQEFQKRLAINYQNLGGSLRESGRLADAAVNFQNAVQLFTTLRDHDPTDIDARSRLARAWISVGNVRRDLGNYDDSVAAYSQALEVQQELIDRDPDNDSLKKSKAGCLWQLATVSFQQRQNDKTRTYYQQAIAEFESLANKNPNDKERAFELAKLNSEYGVTLSDFQQDDASIIYLEKALDIHRQLAEDFPSIENYSYELARTLRNTANTLRYLKRLDESADCIKQSVEVFTRLTEKNDSVLKYHSGLGLSFRILAELQYDQGLADESLVSLNRSIETLVKTYQRDTTHTPVQIQLATGYQLRAELLNKRKRFTEAAADWEQALKFCREPDRTEFKIQQAYSLLWAGEIDDALSKANALSREPSLSQYHFIGLSRVYASASVKVPERAEEYMSQARESLKQAIQLGFNRLDRLQNEQDLAPLLSEPYFKELVAPQGSKDTQKD
jgi:serine/threonine protein kinase/tetratricopeptide (TPR) repeat protein